MSFREYNDEGPGTYEWDYVLGGNTTGLFPEESHYEVDGNKLIEVKMVHTGGGRIEPVYGDGWTITNITPVQNGTFTFEQDGTKYRAVINKKYRQNNGCFIVDLKQV